MCIRDSIEARIADPAQSVCHTAGDRDINRLRTLWRSRRIRYRRNTRSDSVDLHQDRMRGFNVVETIDTPVVNSMLARRRENERIGIGLNHAAIDPVERSSHADQIVSGAKRDLHSATKPAVRSSRPGDTRHSYRRSSINPDDARLMCFDVICFINAPVFKRVSAFAGDQKLADDEVRSAAVEPDETA